MPNINDATQAICLAKSNIADFFTPVAPSITAAKIEWVKNQCGYGTFESFRVPNPAMISAAVSSVSSYHSNATGNETSVAILAIPQPEASVLLFAGAVGVAGVLLVVAAVQAFDDLDQNLVKVTEENKLKEDVAVSIATEPKSKAIQVDAQKKDLKPVQRLRPQKVRYEARKLAKRLESLGEKNLVLKKSRKR